MIHKRISFICFALRHMPVVSDNIRPIPLPPANAPNFAGENAIVSGFGLTTQRKCVDPFNLYSTDKE